MRCFGLLGAHTTNTQHTVFGISLVTSVNDSMSADLRSDELEDSIKDSLNTSAGDTMVSLT